MKKNLFLMGMAAMTLASCTNEVLKVADMHTIGFDAFVGNTTRAVTEVKTLNNFYVFGKYCTDNASFDGQIFNNELNTSTYYWHTGNYYRFGAYADGEAGQIIDASYDATSQKLTFPNYTPSDDKDLVAAISSADAVSGIPSTPVSLSFSHMLSQVGFTFNTELKNYTLAIRDIKIKKAIKTATGIYEDGNIKWDGNAEADVAYTYDDIANLAGETSSKASQFKLVIPQQLPTDETSKVTVSFTASISGGGMSQEATKSFELELASPGEGGWKPGFRYNYTATINGDNITNMEVIEFKPEIDNWEDGNTTEIAPQKIISSYVRPNFYETDRVYTESMNACNDLIFMTASPYANGDIYFETPDNTATFTESGVTATDEFNGKKGVMHFDGTGEMNAGQGLLNSATKGVNQFTFATWIYLDEWTSGATLFSKAASSGNNMTSLTLGETEGNLIFRINDQTATLSNSNIVSGKWIHIAMTYGNKGTLRLYVNGDDASATSGTISVNELPFMQTETKLGKGLKGYIDEAYFNFLPLGGGDIRTVMNAEGKLSYKSWNICKTQAYWTFDKENPGKDNHTWVTILNDLRTKLNPGIKLRIGIASGGWQAMCDSPAARQKFANNVKNVLETYNLDGVDLDFEWPANNEGAFNTYNQTVIAVRSTIGYDYTFSVSLHPVSYKMSLEAAKFVDFISIQAYGPSPDRFPMSQFKDDAQAVLAWGFPKDKIVMGVPFYGVTKDGTKSTEAYWNFVQNNLVTSTSQNEVTYKGKLFIYDGADAIRKKTRYTMEQGMAGMMSWDLATDVTLSHEYSLLKAMLKEIPAQPQ